MSYSRVPTTITQPWSWAPTAPATALLLLITLGAAPSARAQVAGDATHDLRCKDGTVLRSNDNGGCSRHGGPIAKAGGDHGRDGKIDSGRGDARRDNGDAKNGDKLLCKDGSHMARQKRRSDDCAGHGGVRDRNN
jgi:hypothetical protein